MTLSDKQNICLVGIGGVSMSGIALVLKQDGRHVFGADRTESKITRRLEAAGIPVHIGHDAKNIEGADLVIRNAAIHDDAPEIRAAREKGIPVMERPDAWGELMTGYGSAICISGMHGKSSTTGFASTIALEAGLDPTITIGAELPAIDGTMHIGAKKLFIAEACEYCNSFLSFKPTYAIVHNIEEDHLDFFKDLDDIKSSFRRYIALVPDHGAVIANIDDANVRDVIAGSDRPIVTYAIDRDADFRALEITFDRGFASFTVAHGSNAQRITLKCPGRHSVMNALAAIAACVSAGICFAAACDGAAKFTGIGRRFEIKGTLNGALVVDDFAHHPTEMTATLKTAMEMGYDRVICAFQSHTYTRTAALFDDFAKALRIPDVTYVLETYAARETNTTGINATDLANAADAPYFSDIRMLAETLKQEAKKGDLILTMGAGDIAALSEFFGDTLVK